jgi:hypothetical protein
MVLRRLGRYPALSIPAPPVVVKLDFGGAACLRYRTVILTLRQASVSVNLHVALLARLVLSACVVLQFPVKNGGVGGQPVFDGNLY